jgi:hypothetical protein
MPIVCDRRRDVSVQPDTKHPGNLSPLTEVSNVRRLARTTAGKQDADSDGFACPHCACRPDGHNDGRAEVVDGDTVDIRDDVRGRLRISFKVL